MTLQFRSPIAPLGAALILVSGAGCAATDVEDGPATSSLVGSSVDASPQAATEDPLHTVLDVALTAEGDWLVSDELSADGAFTEVLPSWNVSTDAPFVVDVRVSPDESGDQWSHWLRIGDWGVTERGDEIWTAFDGGKVAIDVLELKTPHRRAQLRVSRADGEALDRGDVRMSCVLSDLTDLAAATDAAADAPWPVPVQLTVPARSQRRAGDDIAHRICSPTSVAMVAAYHGETVPTRDMAQTVLDPHFDIYGNWNRAVQGAYSYGVPGRLVRVSSWDTVHAYLNAGQPLVASIRAKEGQLTGAPYSSTAGHLLVVTGLGPSGIVHVYDPAASWPGSVPRKYAREEMETVWFANGGVAYAFEPAEREGRPAR